MDKYIKINKFDRVMNVIILSCLMILSIEIYTIVNHNINFDIFLFLKYFIPNLIITMISFVIGYNACKQKLDDNTQKKEMD